VRALERITPEGFDYARGSRALMKHAQDLVRAALLEEMDRINTPARLRYKVARLYRYQRRGVRRAVARELADEARLLAAAAAVETDAALRSGNALLDVGCGLGVVSHWLAERSPRLRVIGVDADGEALRVARRSAAGAPRTREPRHDIGPMRFECKGLHGDAFAFEHLS
jgi:2-polyprenyl-3-methyl-5-hydroxy-6-metoxy-1,4-benzoquinol methylase